jgi:hypothetical protein
VTREEWKYTKCVIERKVKKIIYVNVLKEENTDLRFPSFKTGNSVQKLVASMPEDEALG